MNRMEETLLQGKQAYEKSGENSNVERLFAMAYLLHSIANEYIEDAEDTLRKYGLFVKKLKTRCVNLETAFDLFNKEMCVFMDTDELKKNFCDEYEKLKKVCDKFMNE